MTDPGGCLASARWPLAHIACPRPHSASFRVNEEAFPFGVCAGVSALIALADQT